nr:hypothetical protein [Tanacetum cinerariifolium]
MPQDDSMQYSWQRQAPKKVTGVDFFYLRSMDLGTANVLYLLVQYLFRHAEGRKSGARLSGGHFIGRLTAHFRLAQHLFDVWRYIGFGSLGTKEVAGYCGTSSTTTRSLAPDYVIEDRDDRGVVESSIPEQTRVSTCMISCITQLMDASGRTYQAFYSILVGSSRVPYQRHVRLRTCDASTSIAPHTDDQPDP